MLQRFLQFALAAGEQRLHAAFLGLVQALQYTVGGGAQLAGIGQAPVLGLQGVEFAGAEIELAEFVAVQAEQVDALFTRLGAGANLVQTTPQLGAGGVVFAHRP